MHTTTPETLIAAVQARGNDATTPRDAAHEAHHALSSGLDGPWDRERIHAAVMAMGHGEAAADEIMARAVEQIVCRDLGVDCGPVKDWAVFACIEAVKAGIAYPSLNWFVERVNDYMKSRAARKAADRVIALGASVEP